MADPGKRAPSNLAPSTPTPTTTTHPEKITHAIEKLAAAGLGSTRSSSSTSSIKPATSKKSDTKWIIIGAVAGGIGLLLLLALSWFLYRRYRKKRAYATVSRGVDMTGTPAWRVTSPEGESSGHRPLFLAGSARHQQGDGEDREPLRGRGMSVGGLGSHPTTGSRARSASATSIGGRNRMSMGGEEMFNQDREMDLASGMMEQGRKISEANFESGYDVDTGYDKEALMHGDKRSGGA